ncbi:type II toxin-antitoxin system prevent-host-death family antitoxin [Myxococcota bacterium]|nr:type II toxin-antitoxin system prevent-host-death family antitoxin [Myxococcota bacterium]MBU1429718.1 type II toxin-antitoxin system prevent-host-death family antitoxin [Myxococcota bacterium]
MPITMTSREFNQDTGRAKRAARDGPVFITDRGKPAHVFLSIEEYLKITGGNLNIVEMLSMASDDQIEFDPHPIEGKINQKVDLS